MTLQVEAARARRAQRSPSKQIKRKKQRKQWPLVALPAVLNDNQVLRFKEWCQLNRISERTGRRIFDSGKGPVVTQLSPQRIGITVRANREWQQSRERSATTEASA